MLGFQRAIWIARRPILDVSVDGVDIPLFFNSFGIFTESMLVLLRLLQ